ncbi:MAG: hypothetical protein GY953_45780, partial [bacterium]|nr:hypothetical protein [bacterium]
MGTQPKKQLSPERSARAEAEQTSADMSELAELLERFRRGPELVAVATTGAAGPQINFSPAPGKWSVRQIACHLADSEMVGAIRLRRV